MVTNRRNKTDLKTPVPEKIAKSLGEPKGKGLLIKTDGVHSVYYLEDDLFIGERLSQRLRSELGWFEKLVQHRPTIGTFYEDVLRALLNEHLPTNLKAGTGFIFDPEKENNSKQLDILLYKDFESAPLYRRGDFVVIQPRLAHSQSEVKKRLRLQDVKDIIRATTGSWFGRHPLDPPRCSRLCVFAYSSSSKTSSVFDTIVQELQAFFSDYVSFTVGGNKAHIGISGLVLPSFHFFDRSDYVTTRVRKREKSNLFDVVVSQFEASGKDGLNDYLDEMLCLRRNLADIQDRDFRTYGLRNVLREETLNEGVFLIQRISMIEILRSFPRDRNEIRSFQINGRIPYEVVLPASLELASFEDFRALTRERSAEWITTSKA
ncbi:MAG: DUF6602 domain-containing protein [Methylocystis sp.]|uniref:DUF6602 domain-containing protein n=1 Tax=Methylocystis sp. TaxID=1911079 RepID=UPI003DA22FD0